MRKNQSTLPSLLIYFVTCWFLPSFYSTAYGAVVVWDGGAANGNWSSAANWSGDTLPGSADIATFNSASTKDCTIDVNIDVAGLDIKAPYTGTITQASAVTATLGSSGYKQANGTFVASNDSLTVGGNWSRSGGTFAAGDGTITFNGSGDRTVNFGSSQTLGTVEVAKNGGTLTFSSNGFTATTLSVSSGDAVKFQSGKSFQVTHLTLDGSAGSPINLDSTQPLHPWQLDASSAGTQTISFVKVKHSDASPGAIIHATDNCTDLGFNTNWDFGVAPTLQYATAKPGNLTQVYLRYSEAMDTATAADTAHYTLSGGLSVTAASISSDKKLVTLSSSDDVTLGTTTVTASSAIQSLVGRNLPETTRTIEEGNSNGIPTALEVKLSLSTDDNQSVIQQTGPLMAFDIPNQGLRFTLTLTAPGTAKTTVGVGQIQEPGGASLVTLKGKTSATVITSGGTPNTAKVTVRAVTRGAFKDDFTLRAFVGTEERGVKPATVIKVDVIHSCLYLADQRSVEQKAQVTPPMEGLKLTSQSWLVDKLHASPTSRLAAPAWSLTDASGQATRAFKPCGVLAYCVFTNEVVATENIGEGQFSDYQEIQTSKKSGPDVTAIPIGKTENHLLPSCYTQGSQDGNKKPKGKTGETIYLALGEKVLDLQDLAISGRGLDYEFRRVYRSFNYRGNLALKDFGENWTYSYADERLVKDGTGPELSANVINFRDGHSGAVFVNTGPGKWAAPLQNFVQLRKNPDTGDFEIREESGGVRIYFPFSDIHRGGRLKEIRDRNENRMTFHYESIDPDEAKSGDEKFVLAFVIDTLGREIRYQYYVKTATLPTNNPQFTVASTQVSALGRLARVIDFKGDMDFDGVAESEDFPDQVNNRTLIFDYDAEGNLIRVSLPAIAGTPNGNDFLAGKTWRYQYLVTGDLPGGLTDEQKNRLLHKLTHIWYPNEVKEDVGSNPADPEAAEEVTYETDKTDPFLGYPIAYRAGGINGNGVDSGGTMTYTWTDLNPDRHMPMGVSVDPTRLFNVPTHKVVVVDRNANSAEYIYGGGRNLLEYREFPRGLRSGEPSAYLFTFRYNRDFLPTLRRNPMGNSVQFIFNGRSPDRFQQGNLIRMVQKPDSRGGDQPSIEEVFVYEPIYNRPCLIVQARGANMGKNGFTPPLSDPASRTMKDPYDPTKTLNMRYVQVEFFDFQESPLASTSWPATAGFTPTSVDGVTVKATEVLLIRQLGLAEGPTDTQRTDSIRALRSRLTANLTGLGLGDLNGDGKTDPTSAGNIVRTILGSPVLLAGSNQHKLEEAIDPVDLVRQDKGYMEGGTHEGSEGARLQTIVTMYQYNSFGQLTQTIAAEGNVTAYEYFPELNPDGDRDPITGDPINTPPPADGRALDPQTGGYLKEMVGDTTRSYFDQDGVDRSAPAPPTQHFSNNNQSIQPAPTDISLRYTYDDVGNIITTTDGRGIRTDLFVNEQDEVVQVTEAADISSAVAANPTDPLVGASLGPLTAFAYLSRIFYDFNGNIVLIQAEDRGNTSSVDGSGLGILPTQAIDTTPGLLNADTPGGDAFTDALILCDRLDSPIETRVEVDNAKSLKTRYRYDGNQNRVLTIYPEGNADGAVYDERDLLFKRIQGTNARPSAGLYAVDDPTTFDRPGGTGTLPSTVTYNYDRNRNLTEVVDAADTDLNSSNRSTIAGAGDVTKITTDGYDRQKTVTDPLGNKTLYTYDPDSNVTRMIKNGDPINDGVGSGENKTLEVTEYLYDELSRVIVTHWVLFKTPDVLPQRNNDILLTDHPDMDALAVYLADASSDTATVPGAIGIIVLGRVTALTEYDRENRPTFTIEDDLDVYRTDYDGADRVVRATDSAIRNGFVSGTPGFFDPDNTAQGLSGNTVQMAYDDNSNEIERLETDVATIPGVSSETFRVTRLYDSLDRLQTQADPLGHTMDYRYDSRDNLVATADAQGPVTSRQIHRRGLGNTDPLSVNDFGNIRQYFYDGISRKVKDRSLLTASGQGDGIHIGATLTGVKETTPLPDPGQGGGDGFVDVFYAWDDNSLSSALTDDQGNQTQYTYDNIDRKLTATYGAVVAPALADRDDADKIETLTYDPDHNVKTFADQNGTVTTNLYDALNRLKRSDVTLLSSYGNGDGGVPIKVIGAVASGTYTANSYQYDGLSRRTQAFDANFTGTADDSTATWAYDPLSRLIEESQKIGALATRFTSTSFDIAASEAEYDHSGLIYPEGRQVVCTYDRLDRLVTRSDQEGLTTFSPIATYDYVGTYRTLKRSMQNGVHLDLTDGTGTTYDRNRRPTQWRHAKSGVLRVGFGHQEGSGNPAYDRMNNKLIEEKLHDPGNSETYVYDSLYRLIRPVSTYRAPANAFRRGTLNSGKTDIATLTPTSPVLQTKDWDLDGVGNWQKNTTQYAPGGFSGGTQTRSDTSFNEYHEIGGVPQDNDHNGDLIDGGSSTPSEYTLPETKKRFEWDYRNRLRRVHDNKGTPTQLTDDTLIAQYFYDGVNRRIRKETTAAAVQGSTQTDYLFYGWQILEEHDTLGGDAIAQQYVYGNYIDEPLVLDNRRSNTTLASLNDGSGNERHFYHQNILYHVYGLTDETGNLVEQYLYDPYGRHYLSTGGALMDAGVSSVNNPYLFTGRYFDPETKLLDFRNRIYSPMRGQYLSRWINQSRDVHLYQYQFSRPIYYVDPMGDPEGWLQDLANWYNYLFPPKPPPLVEVTDLKTGKRKKVRLNIQKLLPRRTAEEQKEYVKKSAEDEAKKKIMLEGCQEFIKAGVKTIVVVGVAQKLAMDALDPISPPPPPGGGTGGSNPPVNPPVNDPRDVRIDDDFARDFIQGDPGDMPGDGDLSPGDIIGGKPPRLHDPQGLLDAEFKDPFGFDTPLPTPNIPEK